MRETTQREREVDEKLDEAASSLDWIPPAVVLIAAVALLVALAALG